MKVLFQQVPEWDAIPNAEAELAIRMVRAAKSCGFEALATSCHQEIDRFQPDLLIPLHFLIPKLFDAFTVGALWNPIPMASKDFRSLDNIKSYDGFGVASNSQKEFVKALKFKSPLPYLISTLYPSCNATVFRAPKQFKRPVYIGSNWNKERHKDFFSVVTDIQVYGSSDGWAYLPDRRIYQGEVAFDGASALDIYHEAGIGLALHHDLHLREGIPSMRPFEIAASGAVMISDRNVFIENVFNDSALYLDTTEDTSTLIEQLTAHLSWIRGNPGKAREMAAAAHEIFLNKFSLEVLLTNLVDDVRSFQKQQTLDPVIEYPSVEIIVRSDGTQRDRLLRAIKSIANQVYPNVTARVVYRGCREDLETLKEVIQEVVPMLKVYYTLVKESYDRGTQFYKGLRATEASYLGYLDHDDILFHDHVHLLMRVFETDAFAGLVYGGSIGCWEGGLPEGATPRKMAYFHDMEGFEERAFITSNSYLLKKDRIPWSVLNQPIPEIDCREDRLFLQLLRRAEVKFVFSEKVTNAYFCLASKEGHSNENEAIMQRGASVARLIERNATSPWKHPDNRLPDKEVRFLNQIITLCSKVCGGAGRLVHRVKKAILFRPAD